MNLKNYLFIGLLVISILVNIFFIVGKGIQIYNTFNNQQYQNQQQSQLLVGMFAAKGNITWEKMTLKDIENNGLNGKDEDLILGYLKTLSPEQALFAKIYDNIVYIPKITEKE
jgi:hypothetical protein